MPQAPAEPVSPPTEADPIAAARAAFETKFDETIASALQPVATDEGEKAAVQAPPGEPVKDTPGQGPQEGAERPTEQPEPKSEAPEGKDEEKPQPPKEAPPPEAKGDPAARLKADRELNDYVQRQLQSARDRALAEANKQAKAQGIRQSNTAFAADWEAMSAEDKTAWMETQQEYQQSVQGAVAAAASSLAGDLMDLLGADAGKITPEMLTPEGRDALREVLLGGSSVAAKLKSTRDEAFAAGEAAARAKMRGHEKSPPTGGEAPVSRPKDLREARTTLETELSRLGF